MKLNRKTKKLVTIVVVLLFFLAAGAWYFFRNGKTAEQQEDNKKLTGVLDTALKEVTLVPDTEDASAKKEPAGELVVYVCGAVNTPGIYTLPEQSRLYEAVTLAGGFSKEADPSYHNLARSIEDGERIYILSVEETRELSAEQHVGGEEAAKDAFTGAGAVLNLNTATAEQLMELPGIGEAKAAGILEYRSKIGKFTDIEEIMNVSGIGEAMYEKIKDKITVK